MKNIIAVILISIVSIPAVFGQHEADNWYFGNGAGVTFNTTPPTSVIGGQIFTNEGCATISNINGNLLFYSDGATVWDRNNSIMPNGTGLNGSGTCTQSAIIVPNPGNELLYYIFTPPDEFTSNPFCYSIVDISLNNGNGDLTSKNIALFNQSTEKVTAVRHSNGRDIWVIGHGFNNSDFYAYIVSSAGVDTIPVISSTGTINGGTNNNNIGAMKASPCGDKIALVVFENFLELFDFDNSTGIVSNPIHLGDYISTNGWGIYSTEFSPDGSKLYFTQENPAMIVQYDVHAGSSTAIIASADTIVYSGFDNYGTLQNAPDGKIYISNFYNGWLSCINNPNDLGSACNFINNSQIISASLTHGLPNFITSYFCNLNTGINNSNSSGSFLKIYPNPANTTLTIFCEETIRLQNERITITNLIGEAIIVSEIYNSFNKKNKVDLNISKLSPGVYFVKVGKTLSKFLKM